MELAIIGLGKMGMNMATRLVRDGQRVIGYARTDATVEEAVKNGAEGAHSLEEVVSKLNAPRIVWVMVPAGKATDDTINKLSGLLDKGDIIIDGGNSNYKESARHAVELEPKGIEFLDCGTSGGIWGLSEGYSMMIGGKPDVVETMRPIFETLAPGKDKGWGRMGPHGSGHFVKMIHNGIEYGMMQAFCFRCRPLIVFPSRDALRPLPGTADRVVPVRTG
jgi:6-phosphogluconate dehydrogenase